MTSKCRKEYEAGRENFYRFFAGVFFSPPTKATHEVFLDDDYFEGLNQIFSPDSLSLLEEFRKKGTTPEIIQEFENLFRVPGPWYTTPYESVFVDSREIAGKDVGGLLHGKCAHAVEKLYRKFGLVIGGNTPDLPDYLGVELSFMAHLASGNPEKFPELSGEILIKIQREFLNDHLLPWVPRFAENLIHKTKFGYYRAIAKMLVEFIKHDFEFLNAGSPTANSD